MKHNSETLQEKVQRIMNMNTGFKFRLSALLASDNRPGKVWH